MLRAFSSLQLSETQRLLAYNASLYRSSSSVYHCSCLTRSSGSTNKPNDCYLSNPKFSPLPSKIPVALYSGLSSIKPRKDKLTNQERKMGSIAAYFVENSHSSVRPYLKLIRADKPIGSWLLFWPWGWSIALAAAPGSLPDFTALTICGLVSCILRGAGCTVNDMWDKDIDGKVSRTKERPLVLGNISQPNALCFFGGQLGVALLLLQYFNPYTVALGASSFALLTSYPLMKRITNWPQLFLGVSVNWGVLIGYAAVHGSCDWSLCLPLYVAGVSWTVIYDTIYAHQDRQEDSKLGLKSTAIYFGENTDKWLSGFSALMLSNLVLSGLQCDQTWPYYASLSLIAAHLARQIYTLDIKNAPECHKKFLANNHVGLILFLGIVIGNLMKPKQTSEEEIIDSLWQ